MSLKIQTSKTHESKSKKQNETGTIFVCGKESNELKFAKSFEFYTLLLLLYTYERDRDNMGMRDKIEM